MSDGKHPWEYSDDMDEYFTRPTERETKANVLTFPTFEQTGIAKTCYRDLLTQPRTFHIIHAILQESSQ